jgi:hypothetical protein
MEALEDKIKKFLAVDVGYGDCSGYGYGDGSGDGDGYGYGSGDGYGYGDGSGDGDGYGDGDGDGDGSGDGSGYGDGYGYGDGSGYGDGYGYGVKAVKRNKVYMVDNTITIFKSIRGNVAKGYILQSDLQLKSCFIVKENNKFAHGDTLRDAFTSLQEKLYDDSTEEERIEAFKKKFPEYDVKYDNGDLFTYHHVLTGSCRMGREAFVSDRGLSLDGKTSIREFVELTKNAYGGDIIKKLPSAYRIK